MPLRALTADEGLELLASDVPDVTFDEWRGLGSRKRARLGIAFRCVHCDTELHPALVWGTAGRVKTFRHKPRSECPFAGRESYEHAALKTFMAGCLQVAGYDTTVEHAEADVRVDVLARRPSDRRPARAIEIQLSRQDIDVTDDRTTRIERALRVDRAAVAWVTTDPARIGANPNDEDLRALIPWMRITEDGPAGGVRGPVVLEGAWDAPLEPANPITLGRFTKLALYDASKRLPTVRYEWVQGFGYGLRIDQRGQNYAAWLNADDTPVPMKPKRPRPDFRSEGQVEDRCDRVMPPAPKRDAIRKQLTPTACPYCGKNVGDWSFYTHLALVHPSLLRGRK